MVELRDQSARFLYQYIWTHITEQTDFRLGGYLHHQIYSHLNSNTRQILSTILERHLRVK